MPNIQIVGNILNTTNISRYQAQDINLLTPEDLSDGFGLPGDFIENYVYDAGGTLLNATYNYKNFSLPSGSFINPASGTLPVIEIDPVSDLQVLGYNTGEFNTQYNFFRNKLGSVNSQFFLSEISSDRTEIRIASTTLSNTQISSSVAALISESINRTYYTDYLVNFGTNQQAVAVNIALDTSTSLYTVLFKLYQPLPPQFVVKSTLWIVEEIVSPYIFDIDLSKFIIPDPLPQLRGPNFNIEIKAHNTVTTPYQNYNSLIGFNQQANSSSFGQILNFLNNSGSVQINIDYTNFSDFVNFSSAQARLVNFYNKVQNIENANNFISLYSPFVNTTGSLQGTINILSQSIQDTITNFDGYEYYLYFNSGAFAWPKVNSTLPYTLQSTGSATSITWFGAMTSSASIYDSNNQNNLMYVIPMYIQEDPTYDPYFDFANMIGQYFDSIWIYLESITELYINNNATNIGISKDLVYSALESLGINLYNSQGDEDFFSYIIGNNSGSATDLSNVPFKDAVIETYKRIYHNLPYLVKTKGTRQGLRALISCFGIPDTIMRINEFGGNVKSNTTIDQIYDRFSYALDFGGQGYVKIPWLPLTQNAYKYIRNDIVPDAIEFRFQVYDNYNTPTQSLFEVISNGGVTQFGLQLIQSGSTGSLSFKLNGNSGFLSSSTIVFPLTGSEFTHPWWTVLLRRDTGSLDLNQTGSNQNYSLFLADAANNGELGFQYSASLFISGNNPSYNASWNNYNPASTINTSYYGYLGGQNENSTLSPINTFFSGTMQEFRYWSTPLSQSAFNTHVLNPLSYEEDNPTASFFDLAFRLALGNDLLTGSYTNGNAISSSHPDQQISASFIGGTMGSIYGASLYGFSNYGFSISGSFFSNAFAENFGNISSSNGNYTSSTEYYYIVAPDSGLTVRTTEKIRISDIQVTGSVLSPYTSIQEQPFVPITNDNQYLDVSFSPINEINDDIINQLGGFSYDNYIGDPHDLYSGSYNALNTLKTFYFEKYLRKYNFYDYIRLIQFFDNSLFKMIKDFVPARANLSTGITFQSPLLERNKIKNTRVSSSVDTGSCAEFPSSSITTDTSYLYDQLSGDKSVFFTGEFTGSEMDIYNTYFLPYNYNPYLYLTSSQDAAYFYNSDFNSYLNNVSSSRLSLIRKTFEIEPYTGKIVSSSAQLQDSYLSLKSYIDSRYTGVTASSLVYNTYTTASGTYPGDNSYGQSAAIDLNTLKFAWIKQISPTNLNFFDKTSIIIKYLVDGSGSLTELSRHNYNIFEVQNTFKSGTPTIVSISDLVHPSNQYSLDGDKMIFEGGFSYSPLLFREDDEPMTYTFLSPLITSSSVASVMTQQKIFEYNTANKPPSTRPPNIDTSLGGYTLTYGGTVETAGVYASAKIQPAISWSYFFDGTLAEQSQVFISTFNSGAPGFYNIDSNANNNVYQFNNAFLTFNDQTSSNDPLFDYVQLNDLSYAYVVPRSSTYQVDVNVPFVFSINESTAPGATIFKPVIVIESNPNPNGGGSWSFVANSSISYVEFGSQGQQGYDSVRSNIYMDFDSYDPDTPIKVLLNISGDFNFTIGQYLRFTFFFCRWNNFVEADNFINMAVNNQFISPPVTPYPIQKGVISLVDTLHTTTIVETTGSYNQNDMFFVSGSNSNYLVFTDSASLLWDKVIFTPLTTSISEPLYSPISFPFNIEVGDIVRLSSYYSFDPPYYQVISVIPPVTGSDGITVFSDLKIELDQSIGNSPIGVSDSFVIFRRLPDETSVILNFNKAPGATSQALLIPYDIDLNVKNNIANLSSQLAQSLNSSISTS